jgi:cytochrome d ubiquinol oxidase subunit I
MDSGLVELARILSGLGIFSHAVILGLLLGVPWVIVAIEMIALKRRSDDHLKLAQRLTKALVILFGTGAALGTLVEFGMVTVWSQFSLAGGQNLFYPFYMEIFAFFAEVVLLVLYYVSWGKFRSRWIHPIIGLAVGVGSNLSGLLITSVNGFMQYPLVGADLVGGRLVVTDPILAFFNQNTLTVAFHTLVAGWLYSFALVAGVYAFRLWRKKEGGPATWTIFKVTTLMIPVLILVNGLVGDFQGKLLADYAPSRLASIEGLWDTQASGIQNFLAYGDWNHPILGLSTFQPDLRPILFGPIFPIKIGLAAAALIFTALVSLFIIRKKPISSIWLKLSVVDAFVIILVSALGWILAEVGRNPWVIWGVMTTSDAMTPTFYMATPVLLVAPIMMVGALAAIIYTVYFVMYRG